MPAVLAKKHHNICSDFGLKIDSKPTHDKTQINLSRHSDTHQISKDRTGSYNISDLPFSQNAKGELFDGDKKILSWHVSESHDLIIDIDCDEQVNLWDHFSVKNLFVKSKGPLLMGGKVDCTHSMITKSQSFATLEPINCHETLVTETDNGVGFFSPVSCKSSVIKSAAIYQTDSLDVKEQADFTCKLFSSNENAKLASPILRLVSETARLSGQVDIQDKCFITANYLSFGQDKTKSKINMTGENCLNIDTLMTYGDSHISIKGNGERLSYLRVKNNSLITENTHFRLDNITSDMEVIDLSGTLKASQTALSCENVLNRGVCEIENSQLAINQSIVTNNGGQLKVTQSHAVIHQSQCLDGQTVYDNALVLGKTHFIQKGNLSITNQSKVYLTDEIRSSQNASVKVSNSTLSNGKKVVLRGSVNIDNATLEAPVVHCTTPDLKAQKYKIIAPIEVQLSGHPQLQKGSIDTKKLSVKGEVSIDDARFYVTDSEFKIPKADVNNMRLRTKSLDLEGGLSSGDVQLTDCSINTEHFATRKQVKISRSIVNIIGDGEKIQSLGENVELDKTFLFSKKRILQECSGQLSLTGHSHISAPDLSSRGTIDSHFSTIFGQRLSQIKGAFNGEQTHIYLTDSLNMIDSNASLGDKSTCVVPEIRFHGSQSELTGQSRLIASKSITVEETSKLKVKEAMAVTKDVTAFGDLSLDASVLAAENIAVYQAFDIANHSQVDAEGLIAAAKGSVTTLKDSQMKGKDVDLKGDMSVSAGLLKAEEVVKVAKDSTLSLAPESIVMAKNIDVSGSIELPKECEVDEEADAKSVPAQLRVDEKLIVHSDAEITGEGSLLAEIHDLLNFGLVSIGGNLISRGALLYNWGKLSADSIYLGYDDAVVNTGLISAREMTVHSNFVNFLGGVAVKQSMTCSGLYSLNIGAIAANNYSNTNLLSLNAGLVLPIFSVNAKNIFSVNNLINVGRTVFNAAMPGYSNLINLGFMASGVIQSGSSFYDLYQKSSLADLKKMRRHEWMPYAGQIYSSAILGINTASAVYHSGYELNTVRMKGIYSGFAKPEWKKIGLKTAILFADSYRDSSLIHLNTGVSVAASTTKSSLLHTNTGVETSILAHAINSHWLYNKGASVGTESSFTASSVYNEGTLAGGVSFFMDTDHLTNTEDGHIEANHGIVKAKDLKQRGELTITDGLLSADDMANTGHTILERDRVEIGNLSQEAKLDISDTSGEIQHFYDANDAETDIKNSSFTGRTFATQGHMELGRVSLNYEEWVRVQEQGKVHSKNVSIKTAEFENAGNWEYEEVLSVKAKKAKVSETGVINGAKSDEADLFKDKDQSEQSDPEILPLEDDDKSDSSDKKDDGVDKVFDPKHVFMLDAEEGEIDGQLAGGDFTQIRGQQPEQESFEGDEALSTKKSQHLHFGKDAQVDLKYGSIEAVDIVNTGHLHLDSFSVDLDHFSQQGQVEIERTGGTITQLDDNEGASTKISESSLKGDKAHFRGHLDASQSAFEYNTSFVIDTTSKAHTDNVVIKSGEFDDRGDLEYEDYLEINADHARIAAGAVLNGERSSEDELFQEKPKKEADGDSQAVKDASEEPKSSDAEPKKEDTPGKEGGENASDKSNSTDGDKSIGDTEEKEPEKEFKPKHILAINAKNVDLDGKLSGGDYTQIHGKKVTSPETPAASDSASPTDDAVESEEISKCDAIHVGGHADIDLHYGSISSKSMNVDGEMKLKGFTLDIDQTRVYDSGHLVEVQTSMKGVDIESNGQFDLKESAVDMTGEVRLSERAQACWEDSSVKAHQVKDASHMNTKGQVAIFTDDYQHNGLVEAVAQDEGSDKKNLFYVESKTASLDGKSNLNSAVYNIYDFNAAEALIRGDGKYSYYQFSDSLGVEVDRDINLTGIVNRSCGLTVKGKSVRVNTNYKTDHDLTFISTQGDVLLSGVLNAANVYGQSAAAMYSNATIHAADLVCLNAEGNFENVGGMINGDQVAITAKAIMNLTKGSGHKLAMGKNGVINGRSNVFLDAIDGNIENHGGMIRAGKYAQLTATGNVKNLCNVGSHWNGYEWVNDYDAGLISGGTGVDTDDVGLYIKADGKVISDASDFISDGINYIEGDKGLDFGARSQTYISGQKTSKKWYGKKQTHTEYSTKVRGSTIHSGSKYNIFKTEHGGMEAVATQFSSPSGNLVYARDDVNCYSIKTSSRTVDAKSILWGLNKSKHTEFYEDATPTLFIDNGLTRIVSSEGTINARGAYFGGAGDLEMEAQHRIKFGCDVLDHEITDKTRSFGISVPGSQAYSAWKSGGSWADVATAEDATIAKLNRMGSCGNSEELLANSANLGIDLYNTTSSVMRGLANDSLSSELLSRYGLGGANGFSPTITLSYSESKQTTKYQTLGPGGVNKGGNVKLKAGDGIDLENGVRVHCDGDMDIDAPELLLYDASLHSSFDQKTRSESVGFTPSGQIQSASYSQSKTHAEATTHVNAELSSGGNLYLHHGEEAMDRVDLDGGNIECVTLDAKINHLNIRDKQDISSSRTESASVSTTCQVSYYKGKSSEKTTNQHSGIHVKDGINNNGHSVHVHEAYMEGGKITSDGKNDIEIDHLVTTELHDESHSSGFGVSVNLNDLGRIAGRQSTNEIGEQAIATAEMTYDYVHYEATQTSVIHGEQGTDIRIGELEGSIHTDSADGRTVTKDKEFHLVIDVPLTNGSYLESASKNIEAGSAKIAEMIGAGSVEQPVDIKELDRAKHEKNIVTPDDDDFDALSNDLDDLEDFVEPEELGEVEDEFLESAIPSIGDVEFDDAPLLPANKDILTEELYQELQNNPEVLKADKELKQKADIYKNDPSPENKAQLEEAIKHSVMVIMKETSENGWDVIKGMVTQELESHIQKVVGSAENGFNLYTKTYMNSKGYLITFAFNLGILSIDSNVKSGDVIKDAAVSTTADVVLGIIIKSVAGEAAAGPIGWAFVGLDVLDSLFYDQKQVDKLINSGLDYLAEAQRLRREGHYFASFGLQQLAADQNRSASLAQAAHILARTEDYLIDGVKWTGRQIADGAKWVWDHTPSPFSRAKPPVIDDSNQNVSANQHSFFNNDNKPADKDKKQDKEAKSSQAALKC